MRVRWIPGADCPWAIWSLLALMLAGCSLPRLAGSRQTCAQEELQTLNAGDLGCATPGAFVLPPHVNLADGVDEDEVVATALANNSAFQATLAQLGMAEGDLVQAGLLTNPSLTSFIPVGVKQWEWTLYVPLEAFVLRPQRVSIAEGQHEQVAHQLMQNGFTLVRDARIAYADLAVAIAQWKLGLEAVKIRQSIKDLTEKRLQRGDISELEAITARIDALNATANTALLEQAVLVASSRLALVMGLPPDESNLQAKLSKPESVAELDAGVLIDTALAARPDAQAARWGVAAAARRARISRWQFLRVDAVADANAKGLRGFEVGPGLRFDVPIFNRNQGGVMRADAELRQALHNRDAIDEQIVQEVRVAVAQWVQAEKQLAILQQQVAPALKEALQIAEKGYADGGTDYLLVLLTTSQYLDARTRILDQIAALRRARAELERSVAGKLTAELADLPSPISSDIGLPDAMEEIQP